MMKLAVIIAFIGAAAASGVPVVPVVSRVVSPVITPVISSQRAIIPQIPSYGYGYGVSSRYFDKADYGYGSGVYGLGLGGFRGIAPAYYGGLDTLGLAYNNYGLYGNGLGYGYGLGRYGNGFGRFGYGLGRFGYGLGGLRFP